MSVLALLLAAEKTPAQEGRDIILAMLVVGLISEPDQAATPVTAEVIMVSMRPSASALPMAMNSVRHRSNDPKSRRS